MDLLNLDATEVFTFDPYQVLQGEGKFNGLPTTLIRFGKCNLRCSFCDSAYNWDKYYEYTIEKILKYIKLNIMFTGGEPLMNKYRQEFIYSIIEYHKQKINRDFVVEIETNGTNMVLDVLIEKVTSFNISPKESRYQLDNRTEQHRLLQQISFMHDKYIVKFVYDNTEENKRFILDIVEKYQIPEKNVYIMPKGANVDEIMQNIENAFKFAFHNNFLLTPRTHILIYKTAIKDWPQND